MGEISTVRITFDALEDDQIRKMKQRLLSDTCQHNWVPLFDAKPVPLEGSWKGYSLAQECSVCGKLGTFFSWEV